LTSNWTICGPHSTRGTTRTRGPPMTLRVINRRLDEINRQIIGTATPRRRGYCRPCSTACTPRPTAPSQHAQHCTMPTGSRRPWSVDSARRTCRDRVRTARPTRAGDR
jgi:hypothetical protein